jgi:transposase-like protein
MIAMTCRRRGSDEIRKNGLTRKGHQRIHCGNCDFRSTIDLKTSERESRRRIAGKPYSERLSQHAIARTLRMSRTTIRKKLKKK